MNKIFYLKFLRHRWALWIIGLIIITSCRQTSQPPQNYNVLFIAVDDLRTELNCYGAEHIHSPHIDRLAATGVRFNHAYVQQAICMASRASILTGIRPEKKGIYTGESVQDLLHEVMTLNKFFEQKDYNIASCGKIYHYGEDTEDQFGDAYMEPRVTWEGRGYVTTEAVNKIKLNTLHQRGPAYEMADVHDTIYKDGINTLNAVRKLAELKNAEKPFFLAVGLSKPHLPFVAPKKYWDLYPPDSIKFPAIREMPVNSNQYTMRRKGELNNYYGIPPTYEEMEDSLALTLRRAYYACVSYIDAQVGKLLDELDALELSDNTIVVLWGDHGYKIGDYGNWCKWSNMDIDTRIPLIMRVPGDDSGGVIEEVVEALDIYPTLANLVGFQSPEHVDGQSLVPLLQLSNQVSTKERFAYSVWPHDRRDYDKTIMGYSVKNKRYNYTEWVKLSSGEILEKELYDHQHDPYETLNVAGKDEYADLIMSLSSALKERKEGTDHDHAFKKIR